MRIAAASDHAGVPLKEEIKKFLGQGPCKVSVAWPDLRFRWPAAEVELAEPPLCPSSAR
jgi:ribose 5-phosphate isomerase RpiB